MVDAILPRAGDRSNGVVAAGLGPWLPLVLLSALPWLAKGWLWALAGLVGGLVVVAGSWLLGRMALAGGVQSSVNVLSRLLAGMVFKWVVVITGLVAGAAFGLPPLPMLTGVVAALIAQMLVLSGRRQTSRA